MGWTMVENKEVSQKLWLEFRLMWLKTKEKSALEDEKLQNMAVEAKMNNQGKGQQGQTISSESRRLGCIYENDTLVFEKDPLNSIQKMEAQVPLEEVDMGDVVAKRPTYISIRVGSKMKVKLIELLKEYKDCFSWEYGEMHGLS